MMLRKRANAPRAAVAGAIQLRLRAPLARARRRAAPAPPAAAASGAGAAQPWNEGDQGADIVGGTASGPEPPGGDARRGGLPAALAAVPLLGPVAAALTAYIGRVGGLWRRFLPMLTLFFLLSFVNTILDSTKDTLVITAAGGGAAVIPWLTVYAVLPSSVAFLVAYAWASQRIGRAPLFAIIIGGFCAFFASFAAFLLPNADTLHLHALADSLQRSLPAGVAGGIGMVRNWSFTLFYCAAELWGDVCMGLLFWGLANDTTSLEHAPVLYPLFGIGANLAAATAGIVLKVTTAARGRGGSTFVGEVQTMMTVVLAMAAAAVVVHHFIATRAPRPAKQAAAPRVRPPARDAAAPSPDDAAAVSPRAASSSWAGGVSSSAANPRNACSGAAAAGEWSVAWTNGDGGSSRSDSARPAGSGRVISSSGGGGGVSPTAAATAPDAEPAGAASSSSSGSSGAGGGAPALPQREGKLTLREAFALLSASLEIRCLAVMSLAQGLCTSLHEFAWKAHLRQLYPDPSAFTSFLGDVALATGVTTACLMLAAPLLFERLGWRGVASATPQILLYGGTAFWAACIAYQSLYAPAAAAAGGPAALAPGGWLLQAVVLAGALLFVLSKGSKFSLFKPAEEMIYILLDDNARTRGKAAIDVVGSQAGKSGGSMLQQALLLLSAGAIGGPILPLMYACYFAMLGGWRAAVHDLSAGRRITMTSPMHTGEDEDDGARGGGGGGATVLAPARPAGVPAGSAGAALAAAAEGAGVAATTAAAAAGTTAPAAAAAPTTAGNGAAPRSSGTAPDAALGSGASAA